jgi:tmRNA-binding protein
MSIKKNEVNYTSEMVSEIAAMTPINLEKAKELSVLLNRSVRSIIAKTKREGIDYISVKPAAKRVKGKTKAELVAAISKKIQKPMEGLEKAPALVLGELLASL